VVILDQIPATAGLGVEGGRLGKLPDRAAAGLGRSWGAAERPVHGGSEGSAHRGERR
jgi:hypothetical protein